LKFCTYHFKDDDRRRNANHDVQQSFKPFVSAKTHYANEDSEDTEIIINVANYSDYTDEVLKYIEIQLMSATFA